MRFCRSTVAVWLLLTFGACYAFPVTAILQSRASTCCHHAGHGSCCRKSTGAGSFRTAATGCAPGCRLPAGISVHASPLVAPGVAATLAPVRSETLVPRNTRSVGFSSYFAFLHQRPPPPRF